MYGKNKNKDVHDQEDLVRSFLENFTASYTTDTTDDSSIVEEETTAYLNDTPHLSLRDYTQIYIPEKTQSKITRLQNIIKSLDDRIVIQKAIAQNQKKFKIDYFNRLNNNQYLAATTLKGPVLVIAGAGSGKTHTIIHRTSYLLENGMPPEKILLLTFTRRAATEIVNRTSKLLQDKSAERIIRGTYHSFSNHLLRRYAKMLGISPQFTIIDTGDSEDIIDLIRQELKLAKKSRAFPRKKRIQTVISRARNCNISIEEVLEREYSSLLEFIDDLELVSEMYHKYKKGNNLFDYDDLMEFLRDSLRDNLPFRQRIQALYQYIMIDEFQDTNVVQKQIIDYIAGGHRNIMVVGDDSQSIYAFRGANFENILTFPATYPDCKIIKLEQNYRSNQDILNFMNAVANNARLGYKKMLFSRNNQPFKPIVQRFYDQQSEAEFIADKILDLRERNIPLNQIAVLYRSSFHGNYVQAELLKRDIPYVVVGGIRFTERRHIKDIISYLRLVVNPLDAVAWNRILKLISGIGRVSASKIVMEIHENKGKLNFAKFSRRKYSQNLDDLAQILNKVMSKKMTIATKIELLKEYYTPLLKAQESDYEIRLQDIDVLYSLATRYENLDKFLSDFALDPPSNKFQDRNSPLIDEREEKPVTLSTIHSSKGLEWYCVFVPHLLDGLLPSVRSLKNIENLEEERRLFYVASSRAREQLYFTFPSFVSMWDSFFSQPSRFLVEVDSSMYRMERN